MRAPFVFSKIPWILFGPGSFRKVGAVAAGFGRRVLLVTGARSLEASGRFRELVSMLDGEGLSWERVPVAGEPSPALIDEAVAAHRGAEAVIGVGGGSVIDAGKAISAMLPSGAGVRDFLESVGSGAAHDGSKVPFVAVPTTSGTGSEATKNAVLSVVGPDGFKCSLRHDNFVPDVAIVDPELTLDCPREITAACGMDAFTQLLESYVSTGASPLTDAIALSGIGAAVDCLPAAYEDGGDLDARSGMSYASLLSGITLANAGLGVVHGLAGVLGGMFEIPHGVACGTLLGAATRANMESLRASGEARPLEKYALAASAMPGGTGGSTSEECDRLLAVIDAWTAEFSLPGLGEYGISASDLPRIAERAGLKYNPARLERAELERILAERL